MIASAPGNARAVALLAAFEAQGLSAVAQEDKAALGPGEADRVLEHRGEHISPRAVLREALRSLKEQRKGIEVGRCAGGPGLF